jgi:hypothetical protein
MKRLRSFAALFVAIGSLFLTTPAHAAPFTDWSLSYNTASDANTDCVTFSYTWGSVSKSYPISGSVQNVQFGVTVNNSTTNKIGGNGEVFDSYTIEMQVIDAGTVVDRVFYEETSTKHFAELRTLTSTYTGPAESVNVTLRGIDHGFWGGYFGPVMCGPLLTATQSAPSLPTETPATPTPTSTPEEPVAVPSATAEPTPTDSPTPPPFQFPVDSLYGTVDEGWALTLSAPEGYVFKSVYFASYGTPENYVNGQCHSDVSAQKVEEAFIGNSTATISADNGIFGDPCGGTYKRLQVILIYEPSVPVIVPAPEPPVVTPPVVEPTPTQTPEPTPEPTPTPTETPSEEPTPNPTSEPTPTPTDTPAPTPEPTPSATPEPGPTPEPTPTPEEPAEVIEELAAIEDPRDLTEAQVEQLVEAALETFQTAEQGSPEYEQALEALAVAAQADDPEVSEELAAIPLLGDAAVAVLEVFNDLGNVGADMAPQVREAAEKTVIASVIGVQAAVSAVSAATSVTSTSSNTVRRTQ